MVSVSWAVAPKSAGGQKKRKEGSKEGKNASRESEPPASYTTPESRLGQGRVSPCLPLFSPPNIPASLTCPDLESRMFAALMSR